METNQELDTALESIGCRQNRKKQEIIPVLAGPGSYRDAQNLRRGRVVLPARHKPHARYLGAEVASSSSFSPELQKRRRAVAVAFYSLGRFWTLKRTPWKVRRGMLICCVQNAALHGNECFILNENNWQALDKLVARYARMAMRGAAHTKTEEVVDG